MPQISMYRASVPVLARALRNLATVLRKAAAHAAERKIDASVLLAYRLAPDMFALTRQVQIASDTAKGCVARLASVDVPSYADDETTFEQLLARLERTITFVESFTPEQIDGSEQTGRDAQDAHGRRDVRRAAVPARVRAAERLFPLHDRVRDPAPLRRGRRQEGLPRRAVIEVPSAALAGGGRGEGGNQSFDWLDFVFVLRTSTGASVTGVSSTGAGVAARSFDWLDFVLVFTTPAAGCVAADASLAGVGAATRSFD